MRYLAIDYGKRRTGLALCDREEIITSPLCVLEGQKGLCEKIAHVIEQENIEALVVGLPLNMDDTEGFQVQRVKQFVGQLKRIVSVPFHLQDERLSSFSAEEKIADAGWSRQKKKKHLDAIAAAEILTAFLEQRQ
jgi:putative Holliday junction resolvase